MRRLSSYKAFTLIELLVVISIISLLSSVVLASLNSAREKGRVSGARSFSAQVFHAAGDSAAAIWDFDECSGAVASDRSGNGNNGALSNASWSSDTPSGTGCSLSFNGTNSYVSVPASVTMDAAGGDVTVAAWIKIASGSYSTERIIFEHSVWSSTDTYQLTTFNSTNPVFHFPAMSGSIGSLGYTTNIADGKWHLIVGTLDTQAQKARLYYDGALVAIKNGVTMTISSGTSPSFIGARNGANWFFNGLIDEVRVYTKTLTAREVGDLYAAVSRLLVVR